VKSETHGIFRINPLRELVHFLLSIVEL